MTATRVLLIDDNALYRAAFKRNLLLNNYDVIEAENGDEALTQFQSTPPDIVITDLSMRTPREGLDVIRSIKRADPLTPVVMISAVGTFEEGAEAHALGARKVLSKANIEDHIEDLYKAIDEASAEGQRNRAARAEIESIVANPEQLPANAAQRLRLLSADPKLDPIVRGEAYDALLIATEAELRREGDAQSEQRTADYLAEMATVIPELDKFSEESLKELRTAEMFFHSQGDERRKDSDFSRNMGFSYCFAVENETKMRLRRRLGRFLSSKENMTLVRRLMDPTSRQLDLFFHQYLLRLQQQIPFDFTIDNVKQVLGRIMEHEQRYKPDGLKAIGIILVLFARDYTIKTMRDAIHVSNPLAIRVFESDMHLLRFAHLLVSLQHYRNPYIHPEISEMEKVSKIRETAIQCLKEVAKLS